MASFEVKLKGGTVEIIEGADTYQPDGQFTTFFAWRRDAAPWIAGVCAWPVSAAPRSWPSGAVVMWTRSSE